MRSDLLKAVGRVLDRTLYISTGYEIIRVSADLEHMELLSPTDQINANDGDVFHIQPAIHPGQVCSVFLTMNSDGEDRRIDFRRICLSSGQLNLSDSIPQNSFRSIAEKLAGSAGRLLDISAVMKPNGETVRDGVFVLVPPPVAGNVKSLACLHFC
jgi:hypothetical protein